MLGWLLTPKGTQKQQFAGGLVCAWNSVLFANLAMLSTAGSAESILPLFHGVVSVLSAGLACLGFWRWHQFAFPRAA